MQWSAGPGITCCPSVGAPHSSTNKQAGTIPTDTISFSKSNVQKSGGKASVDHPMELDPFIVAMDVRHDRPCT